jgi:hypothetical protein
MSSRKTVLAVVGSLFALVALGLLIAGAVVISAPATHRTSEGFIVSAATDVSTDGYALTSSQLDLGSIRNDWLPVNLLATIQVTASSRGDAPVFVGIGPTEDVADYLEGVPHDEITRVTDHDVTYLSHEGEAAPALPSEQELWIASSEGTGSQSLVWDIEPGQWTVLIMNADASPDVAVDLSAGARTPWLGVAIAILFIGGLFCAAVGAVVLFFAFRRPPTVHIEDALPAAQTTPR